MDIRPVSSNFQAEALNRELQLHPNGSRDQYCGSAGNPDTARSRREAVKRTIRNVLDRWVFAFI